MTERNRLIAAGVIRPRVSLGWLGLCQRGYRDAGYAKYDRVRSR